MLSPGKTFSVCCLIFCYGAFIEDVFAVEERLDTDLFAEFIRQYCVRSGKSKLTMYGEFRSGGWWSSHLAGRLPRVARDLSKNDIGNNVIDLSFHGPQKLPERAMPPGGSATLIVALYDGLSSVTSFLKRSSDLRLFRSRFNWLIITPEDKKTDLEELFQQMAIYMDSNVHYGVIRSSQVMKIWEVYHVALEKPLRISHFGDWNSWISTTKNDTEDHVSACNSKKRVRDWHLYLAPSSYKYNKRTSLEGIKIKAVTVGIRQYLTNFHRNPNGVLEVTGGLFGEVFRTFEQTINFTYTLKYIPGYAYGNIREHGNNWTGVVGHLASKRADIAICGISQSKWRSSVVDLTTPLIFLNSRLYVYGSPSPYQFDLYLRPFTGGLWIMLAVWFFLLSLLQHILKLAYGALENERKQISLSSEEHKKKKKTNNADIIYSICKTLDKGSLAGETSASTRLLILSGSILFTVASTGYAAKLTSIQAVLRFTPSIENIYDLSKSPDWGMGVLNGSWDRWLMKNAPPNTTMGILWKEKLKKHPSNLFEYPQEGLLRVSKNQKFAYLGDSLECRLMLAGRKVGVIEDVLEEEQGSNTEEEEILPPSVACKVAELPGDIIKMGTSFGLQKYSPIKDLFNYHLMKLWSVGVMRNLRKRYIEHPAKLCDTQSVFKPASIGDTFFSLILFGGGVLFSLIIFAIELIVASLQRNRKICQVRENKPYFKRYIE